MKKRVKIIKAPSGKPSVGDQMGYGLYRGQGVRDFESFPVGDPDSQVRTVYPEVPRSEANIEVEGGGPGKKGEKIIAKDGMSIFDVVGKKHSQGGVPVNAEPGSYVVSNFIQAPKTMQAAMGFEVKSNKGKDNTWAKVLDAKVPTKDYNRLSQILKDAAAGKDVDKYELATAKAKMGVYQDYVSKAALGNELTKAAQGKEFSIPDIAKPALQKMMPQQNPQEEQAEGPEGQNSQEEQQEAMGYGGTYYGLPKALEGQNIIRYKGGKTRGGRMTPGGFENPFNRGDDYLSNWERIIPGISNLDNRSAQSVIYDYILQNNPSAVNDMWKTYGLTNLGKKYKDLVSFTSKDSKGRPTYKFDKDLSSEQMKALKKAYTDSYFGVRQLDPTVEPSISLKPDLTADAPPPEDQPITPTGGGATKWFCTPNGVMPMSADMALSGSGVTYYDSKSEADAACSGQSKKDKDETSTTVQTLKGQQPTDVPMIPYTQDVLNFGNALANQYAYPTIGPLRGRYRGVGIDPAFLSTEAADRLIQSQGRTAMEDASLYAGSPQTINARQAQITSSVLPSMIQNRMQTNAQNIQTDMAARQFNAQIANQEAMSDAATTTALHDDVTRLAMNKAKEKVTGRAKTKNALNQMITNAGDTSLMNRWYPQFAFNPSTYQPFFKGGKGYSDDASASSAGGYDMSKNAELYKQAAAYAMSAGMKDPKDIHQAAMKWMSPYIQPQRTATTRKGMMGYPQSSRTSGYALDYPDDVDDLDLRKNGGMFIPVYKLGGW